ncbi:hypothetical protein LTS08_003861 [Lithohypha guttulata]|nr:hypothetical protein LTS08_003861 [Lithohypha guttulata]
MADYAKKTVAELQEILKSRGLPSSGKKAELVARLTEADKTVETDPVESAPATEDALPEAEPAKEPEPVTQDASTDQQEETSTETVSKEAAAPTAEEKKDYSIGIAASDIDNEMAKRKARAERFKTAPANADAETTETATPDTDAIKHLERAQRFGTGTNAIGKLDEALSSERPRGSKRGAGAVDENATLDDPGLKRNFNKKGGRFNGRKTGGAGKPTGVAKPGSNAFSNEKDKKAAEARKKRFAAQS